MEVNMRRWITRVGIALLLILAGGLAWAWSTGLFDKTEHNAAATTTETSPGATGKLQEALQLAKTAQAKLFSIPGYRCIFLLRKVIVNKLHPNNLILTVLHQPFSV